MMQKTFINSFAYIRIVACFSIIILHELFASTVYFKGDMTSENVLFEKITEHSLMWGVPMFLMVSGALLLNPEKELTATKLWKYLKRVIFALVFFTFIFKGLECLFENKTNFLSDWLLSMLTGQSWAHTWYLYLLISIYLMLPLYKAIAKYLSKNGLLYFIGLMIVFNSLAPVLKIWNIDITSFAIPINTIYPAYIFIGYFIYHNRLPRLISIVTFLLASAAIIFMTIIMNNSADGKLLGLSDDDIAGYSSILIVLQSAALFNILLDIKRPVGKLAASIDECTFGIYLIHMIGIRMVMKWWGVNPYDYGMASFLIFAVLLFVASYIITYSTKKLFNRIN